MPETREIKVLDYGYVKYVEHWGSDERIIEAARMSTNKGFEGWGTGPCLKCQEAGRLSKIDNLYINYDKMKEALGTEDNPGCSHCKGTGKAVGDEKLLAYLWNNKHATPFEMGGMVLEVQAPIFVFREWRTHRTAAQVADEYQWDDCFPGDCSYNEMSARYAPLPNDNYIPTVERLMINSKSNKQAGVIKGAKELTEGDAEWFRDCLQSTYEQQEELYQVALKSGIPKELARVHLPVGRYSRMRACANLRNWLAFLTLRMAENAQWEIRQFANAVAVLIKERFPRTYELFEGRK